MQDQDLAKRIAEKFMADRLHELIEDDIKALQKNPELIYQIMDAWRRGGGPKSSIKPNKKPPKTISGQTAAGILMIVMLIGAFIGLGFSLYFNKSKKEEIQALQSKVKQSKDYVNFAESVKKSLFAPKNSDINLQEDPSLACLVQFSQSFDPKNNAVDPILIDIQERRNNALKLRASTIIHKYFDAANRFSPQDMKPMLASHIIRYFTLENTTPDQVVKQARQWWLIHKDHIEIDYNSLELTIEEDAMLTKVTFKGRYSRQNKKKKSDKIENQLVEQVLKFDQDEKIVYLDSKIIGNKTPIRLGEL